MKGMAMKERLSKKQMFFNKINLTKDDKIYIGVDVHKKSYSVAIWLNDAPAIDFVMPSDNKKLVQMLKKIQIAVKNIVYEAGPTGYSLARELRKANLPVQVIAPSITPRPAAKHSKTDRLDCRTLAKYAANQLLRPIAIPTIQQEQDRQLCRLREQLVSKQKRVKLQVKSFLLQHGICEPEALKSWANYAIEQLRKIKLSEQLRYCLDTLLDELSFLKAQLKNLEQKLNELFGKKRYAKAVRILRTHPAVGPVVSRQFATELFNPKRFTDKTEIAKYLGLAPQITQSGQNLRDGPIMKTGRPQLRSNLIEVAWLWITKDPAARKTYYRILHNTGEKNKAITAMARRMAVNLWKMLCDNKPYVQPV